MKIGSKLKLKFVDYKLQALLLLAGTSSSFAGQLIPLSSAQQIGSDQDIAVSMLKIFQKSILPFVELILAAFVLIKFVSGLWKAYESYQKEPDMGTLKVSITSAMIFIIFAGVGLYLLDVLRTYTF